MEPNAPLYLDLPPAALHPNSRAPVQARFGARSKYRKTSGELAFGWAFLHFGCRPRFRSAILEMTFEIPRPTRGRAQRHDPDNLIAWAKSAVDALTDGGILADDREVVYLPPIQILGTDVGRLGIVIREYEPEVCPLCGKPRSS